MKVIFDRRYKIKYYKNQEFEITAIGNFDYELYEKSLGDKDIKSLGNKDIKSIEYIKYKLTTQSLNFLLIFKSEGKVHIITDPVRSIPAFIYNNNNKIIITDDLRKIYSKKLNNEIVVNYLSSISSMGKENCYKNVYSCQAGEIVTIDNEKISSDRYFEFIPNLEAPQKEIHKFVEEFNILMKNTIEHMIKSAQSLNNWIVPLSGGHDSRIIINSLHKAGVKNVICYSYGTPDNIQSMISKQVADAVGYEWHFVEYTEDKWNELHENSLIDDYVDYVFQGVSIPHLQDFLAVYELKKKNIINSGDIFVPGHTLDFVSGGHLKEVDLAVNDKNSAYERVVSRFSKFENSLSTKKKMVYNIFDQFQGEPSQFQEYLNWQERQAKFIVNSCRVYEFFGYDYRIPFWDRTFVEFWINISPQDRLNRNLLIKSERQGILLDELASIPFDDELTSKKENLILRHKIKRYIPDFIKVAILRLSGKKEYLPDGMNQIYAKKGKTIEDIISPVTDYPEEIQLYMKPYLKRFPYQINSHVLSSLYALRRAYNLNKE